MSRRRDKSGPKGGRGNTKVKPSLIWRLWRLVVEHPRGVLIAGATLLGLIVVLHNWQPTRAKLLVWEPRLPFIVWALIFMLVGYLTGKWIEWAIQQRRIRKGLYRPRVSAEDLAGESKAIDERLPAATAPDEQDAEDPPTIIDRSSKSGRAAKVSDGALQAVDYWSEGDDGAGGPGRLGGRDLPDRRPDRGGEYGPAEDRGGGAAGRYRGEGGRYSDYSDYADSGGRYGDYSDYADSGGRREGGGRRGGARYVDYSDYADYADSAGGRRGGGRRR